MVLGEVPLNPALYLGELAFPSEGGRGMNPCLSLKELPELLVGLGSYQGTRQVQWAIRLLLLTGVRLADLRFATLDQFDFEQGLWCIDVSRHSGHEPVSRHRSKPVYIIPLSTQALGLIDKLCACALPEQRYLFCHRLDPQQTISENTLNMALKRLGFNGRLTSLGIRSTLFEALLELGFKAVWVNAQMYHFNQEKIRRTYNHAQYIAQRRQMMQSWADLLDLREKEARFKRGIF